MTKEEKLKRIYEIIQPTVFFVDPVHTHMAPVKFVMIGDIMDYMRKNNIVDRIALEGILLYQQVYKRLREPLDTQPDFCIDFTYRMLEENGKLTG